MDYLEELEQFLADSKKQKLKKPAVVQQVTPSKVADTVEIKVCPMYMETSTMHILKNPFLEEKITEFLNFKAANKLVPANKNDRPSNVDKPIAKAIPGMRKAHLTHDISIWYTISGADPMVIKLYAVLTHDESGTGEPEKIPAQKSLARQMSGQDFVTIKTVQLPIR